MEDDEVRSCRSLCFSIANSSDFFDGQTIETLETNDVVVVTRIDTVSSQLSSLPAVQLELSAPEPAQETSLPVPNTGTEHMSVIGSQSGVQKWEVGDTFYVNVATWYSEGLCPYPDPEKWFCEGRITRYRSKDKRYFVNFPCLGETYKKTITYLEVRLHSYVNF
jgi:hypothetical protein